MWATTSRWGRISSESTVRVNSARHSVHSNHIWDLVVQLAHPFLGSTGQQLHLFVTAFSRCTIECTFHLLSLASRKTEHKDLCTRQKICVWGMSPSVSTVIIRLNILSIREMTSLDRLQHVSEQDDNPRIRVESLRTDLSESGQTHRHQFLHLAQICFECDQKLESHAKWKFYWVWLCAASAPLVEHARELDPWLCRAWFPNNIHYLLWPQMTPQRHCRVNSTW